MEKQTSVVFNGTPHGFSDECRCVPCRALRQATDAIVSEDVRIVYAEILSPDLAMPPGENAHSLLGDLPPFCRAHAENLVVNYGGVWAIKKIKIESNQEWHHLKFNFCCQLRIVTLNRSRKEESTIKKVEVAADEFPEQWISDAEAIEAVNRFWLAEEVYLEEGAVAWIREEAGATVMQSRSLSAIWTYKGAQFAVQIEAPNGQPVAWKTAHIKAWIRGLHIAKALPRAMLASGLWVVVCFLRSGEAIKVRRRLAPTLPRIPSTVCHLNWMLETEHPE